MSCAHHDRDFIQQLELTFTQFQYNALFSLFICYDVHHADLHRYTKQTRNVTFRFTQFARTFSVAIRAWNSHHIYIWRLFPWLAMKFVWCNRHTHSDMQLYRQPNCVFIFTCYYVLFVIVVIAVPKLQPCTVRLHHALKFASGGRKTHRIENEHKQNYKIKETMKRTKKSESNLKHRYLNGQPSQQEWQK